MNKTKKATKEEDRTFEKACVVFYGLGFICLMCAGYVYAFGIPNFSNLEEQAKFCYEEGGMFYEPSRETYNTALCSFNYMITEDSGVWGDYAMDMVTDEEWAKVTGHKVGSYCFVCWDSGSCSRDVLTKIDNGTRRGTRC